MNLFHYAKIFYHCFRSNLKACRRINNNHIIIRLYYILRTNKLNAKNIKTCTFSIKYISSIISTINMAASSALTIEVGSSPTITSSVCSKLASTLSRDCTSSSRYLIYLLGIFLILFIFLLPPVKV